MHTASVDGRHRESDLTARAQIRDAAIECFAESGFRAPFREIAERAGVSPALITHHFGSKAALRTECDTEVLGRYRSMKTGAIPLVGTAFAALVDGVTHDQAVVSVYILRVLGAGGHAADSFLTDLSSQIGAVLAAYEEAGLVRPSRDEGARAQFFARTMLGSVLVAFLTVEWDTPEGFVKTLVSRSGQFTLPLLELYSEGLLTSTTMLDQFLRAGEDSSAGTSGAAGNERNDNG